MSIQDECRAVLKRASGPMTSAEVAAEIGKPAGPTSKALYGMAADGELEQGENEGGKPTFILDTAAKRAATSTPTPPASAVAAPVGKKRPYTRKTSAAAEPTADAVADSAPLAAYHTIMLPRRTVRLLVAGLLAFGGDLGPDLRDAMLEAVREAA